MKLSPATQIAIKVGLAVAILSALVYFIDLQQILEAAAEADVRWIAAGAVLLVLNLGLEAGLWHYLVRQVHPSVRFGRSLASLLFGHSLGVFTPGRLGEFAGRPLYLPYDDKWELGLMVLAQRMFDLLAVLITGAAMLVLFLQSVAPPRPELWASVAAVGAVLTAMLGVLLFSPRRTYRFLTSITRLRERVRRHLAFLSKLTTRNALALFVLAYLRFAIYATQFVFFLRAFAPELTMHQGYMGVALVQFTKFLLPPITFSDIGVRESASVFFFGYLDVASAAAFNGAIMVYCVNLLVPACLGLPFVLNLHLGRQPEGTIPEEDPDVPGAVTDAPARKAGFNV